jgi:hypothetical protein
MKLKGDRFCIADHPSIMAGRNGISIAGAICAFRAIIMTPQWLAWQLSVPTPGLISSDHFQPGFKCKRMTRWPPTLTASTRALLGSLTSSALAKLLISIDDMTSS